MFEPLTSGIQALVNMGHCWAPVYRLKWVGPAWSGQAVLGSDGPGGQFGEHP
jgi:hypothetical protein